MQAALNLVQSTLHTIAYRSASGHTALGELVRTLEMRIASPHGTHPPTRKAFEPGGDAVALGAARVMARLLSGVRHIADGHLRRGERWLASGAHATGPARGWSLAKYPG